MKEKHVYRFTTLKRRNEVNGDFERVTIVLWDDGTWEELFTQNEWVDRNEKFINMSNVKGIKSAHGNVDRAGLIEILEKLYYSGLYKSMKLLIEP